MPQQLVGDYPINLTILGGCLALYSYDIDNHKTEIWVMKEYKVPSSWILIYEIPYGMPLCISNGSDIIALNFTPLYSNRVSCHSPVTLRIGIRRRKLVCKLFSYALHPIAL
ncbi:hypothetical protein S83_048544 [Arachis hypogaea]